MNLSANFQKVWMSADIRGACIVIVWMFEWYTNVKCLPCAFLAERTFRFELLDCICRAEVCGFSRVCACLSERLVHSWVDVWSEFWSIIKFQLCEGESAALSFGTFRLPRAIGAHLGQQEGLKRKETTQKDAEWKENRIELHWITSKIHPPIRMTTLGAANFLLWVFHCFSNICSRLRLHIIGFGGCHGCTLGLHECFVHSWILVWSDLWSSLKVGLDPRRADKL